MQRNSGVYLHLQLGFGVLALTGCRELPLRIWSFSSNTFLSLSGTEASNGFVHRARESSGREATSLRLSRASAGPGQRASPSSGRSRRLCGSTGGPSPLPEPTSLNGVAEVEFEQTGSRR